MNKTIVIGFSTPNKWKLLSWLIKILLRTSYSHVYLKFHSESLDRDIVYQASGLAVNFIGNHRFLDHHKVIREFKLNISPECHLSTLQFAVDKAGSPYSLRQLLGILIYMLCGIKPKGEDQNTYVCSELIGQIMQEKFNICVNKDLDLITPKDVYHILESNLTQMV